MLFDMHLYSLQRLANVAINALAVTSCVERQRRRCGFSCFKFQTIDHIYFG